MNKKWDHLDDTTRSLHASNRQREAAKPFTALDGVGSPDEISDENPLKQTNRWAMQAKDEHCKQKAMGLNKFNASVYNITR